MKTLSNEQLSIIKQMYRGGKSIYAISKVVEVDKNTIKKYLDEALSVELVAQKVNPGNFKSFVISLKEKFELVKLQTKIELKAYAVESKSADDTEVHHQLDIYMHDIVNTTNTDAPDKRIRLFISESALENVNTTTNKILSMVVTQNDLV